MRLLLIQGANMEWLGLRQPEIYGTTTAAELDRIVLAEAERRKMALTIRYTNIEGEAITWIYQAVRDGFDGLLMNPAGFHYHGYALRDCLRGIKLPYIEIHLSNLDRRGMKSITAEEADGMISGLGIDSYHLALDAMERVLARRNRPA